MLNSKEIYKKATKLRENMYNISPEDICRELNLVYFESEFKKQLGLLTCVSKNYFVIVNRELNDVGKLFVTLHEAGHYIFHKELMGKAFTEKNYLKSTVQIEREANAFAAHFLISDKDVYDAAQNGFDYFQLASEKNVFPEVAQIKLQEMRTLGHNVNICDCPDSKFLLRYEKAFENDEIWF